MESAVINRMSDFIKQNKNVYFAVDNIDFLEDTAFGQNTTHGTVMVIFQEEDGDGQPINTPLQIPQKALSQKLEIAYREEPVINPQAIRFDTYEFDKNSHLLLDMEREDHVWALGCYLSNAINTPATDF